MTCEAENQVLRGFMAIIDGLLNKAENEELKAQQAIRAARIQGVEEGQKLSNDTESYKRQTVAATSQVRQLQTMLDDRAKRIAYLEEQLNEERKLRIQLQLSSQVAAATLYTEKSKD
jgi:hypothetical protein